MSVKLLFILIISLNIYISNLLDVRYVRYSVVNGQNIDFCVGFQVSDLIFPQSLYAEVITTSIDPVGIKISRKSSLLKLLAQHGSCGGNFSYHFKDNENKRVVLHIKFSICKSCDPFDEVKLESSKKIVKDYSLELTSFMEFIKMPIIILHQPFEPIFTAVSEETEEEALKKFKKESCLVAFCPFGIHKISLQNLPIWAAQKLYLLRQIHFQLKSVEPTQKKKQSISLWLRDCVSLISFKEFSVNLFMKSTVKYVEVVMKFYGLWGSDGLDQTCYYYPKDKKDWRCYVDPEDPYSFPWAPHLVLNFDDKKVSPLTDGILFGYYDDIKYYMCNSEEKPRLVTQFTFQNSKVARSYFPEKLATTDSLVVWKPWTLSKFLESSNPNSRHKNCQIFEFKHQPSSTTTSVSDSDENNERIHYE